MLIPHAKVYQDFRIYMKTLGGFKQIHPIKVCIAIQITITGRSMAQWLRRCITKLTVVGSILAEATDFTNFVPFSKVLISNGRLR